MSKIAITREMWKNTKEMSKLYEGYDNSVDEMPKIILVKAIGEVFYGYIEDVNNRCEFNVLHQRGLPMKREEVERIFDIPQIILNKFEE